MSAPVPPQNQLALPPVTSQMLPAITQLTQALGIPREVLASDTEIAYAWNDLPRELNAIPPALRGELIARMCVAVSTGLFDGAINYAWNATILHLRQRVRGFGLPVVSQILQKDFEERHLGELKDSELLELCLKLNLITEDGNFFLDQCRDTRNNFSAAHPTMGKINDREFTTFLNRCVRYALSDSSSPRGVDVAALLTALKINRFTSGQKDIWVDRIRQTHDSQRQLIFGMIHGIYCDPASSEFVRLNALDISTAWASNFTSAIRSDLINRHSDYLAKGDSQRHTASQQFFEKLGMLNLLNESERHSMISSAALRLWSVHQAMDNFYNEPPFAERLRNISEQGQIPETATEQFVQIVVCCYIGNGYGVSRAAVSDYEAMIRSFSPREVNTVLALAAQQDSTLGRRLQNINCRRRFVAAVRLIDTATVPSAARSAYDYWIAMSI